MLYVLSRPMQRWRPPRLLLLPACPQPRQSLRLSLYSKITHLQVVIRLSSTSGNSDDNQSQPGSAQAVPESTPRDCDSTNGLENPASTRSAGQADISNSSLSPAEKHAQNTHPDDIATSTHAHRRHRKPPLVPQKLLKRDQFRGWGQQHPYLVAKPTARPEQPTLEWDIWKRVWRKHRSYWDQFSRAAPRRLQRKDTGQAQLFHSWRRKLWRAKALVATHGPQGRFETLFLRKLLQHQSVEVMSEEWKSVPVEQRRQKFYTTALSCVRSHPDKLPYILEAVFPHTTPRPPFYVMETLVDLVVKGYVMMREDDQAGRWECMRAIHSLIRTIIRSSPPGYLKPGSPTLYRVIHSFGREELAGFYQDLLQSGHQPSTNTMLQFASRFAKESMRHKHEAINILEKLVATKVFDMNSKAGASICNSILKMHRDDKDMKPIELTQRLLAIGAQPDLFTYTTLISNLCKAGEIQTAWSVYNTMKEEGIEPDSWVYTNLMIGSLRGDDAASLHRAVSNAVVGSLFKTNNWDVFLYTILRWPMPSHKGHYGVQARMRLAMKAFSKIFDDKDLKYLLDSEAKTPLEDLLMGTIVDINSDIIPIIDALPQETGDCLLKPSVETLRLMVCAYVRSLVTPYSIFQFHMLFDKLLRAGDQLVVALVDGNPAVHNSIMKALCSYDMSRHVAYHMLTSMLQQQEKPADFTSMLEDGAELRDFGPLTATELKRHPRPNKITWTIILEGLMQDGQVKQAEALLDMMSEQGCPPDLATYNALASGYARAQNVAGVVSALQRMERAGFASDSRTVMAFKNLGEHNQRLAIKQMENVIDENKKLVEKELWSKRTDDDLLNLERQMDGFSML